MNNNKPYSMRVLSLVLGALLLSGCGAGSGATGEKNSMVCAGEITIHFETQREFDKACIDYIESKRQVEK